MDLLAGYGSDSSDDSSEASSALPNSKTVAVAAASSTATKANSQSGSIAAATKTRVNRKGRKLVSLHAVLPQHILDQLIKSEAQGWEESDEEGPNNNHGPLSTARAFKNTEKQPPTKQASSSQHRDVGISSFLSELKSTATTTIDNSERKLAPPTTIAPPVVKPEETARSHLVTMQNEPQPRSESTVSPFSQVEEPVVSKKFMFNRPSHIVAAPRIVPNGSNSASTTVPEYESSQRERRQPATTLPNSSLTAASASSSSQQQQQGYNKRSRRAMEQALRSGNFAALGGDDQVPMTSLEAPPPDAYEPPDEHSNNSRPTHGVKVVPVKMYDPKAGIDVTSGQVSGKQRSKHQITQLMVSAAALEMKRARGMGGSDAGTAHRADAKRKYGW